MMLPIQGIGEWEEDSSSATSAPAHGNYGYGSEFPYWWRAQRSCQVSASDPPEIQAVKTLHADILKRNQEAEQRRADCHAQGRDCSGDYPYQPLPSIPGCPDIWIPWETMPSYSVLPRTEQSIVQSGQQAAQRMVNQIQADLWRTRTVGRDTAPEETARVDNRAPSSGSGGFSLDSKTMMIVGAALAALLVLRR